MVLWSGSLVETTLLIVDSRDTLVVEDPGEVKCVNIADWRTRDGNLQARKPQELSTREVSGIRNASGSVFVSEMLGMPRVAVYIMWKWGWPSMAVDLLQPRFY